MADENQPSKKRAAGRELSRDNPGLDDEEDVSEQEMGTFKKATDEVIAGRRIVKVRRQQNSTPSSTPSSNPFAGIRLVPHANATTEAQPLEDKTTSEDPNQKEDATDEETEVTSKESEEKPKDDKEKESSEEKPVEAKQPEITTEPNPTDEKETKAECDAEEQAESAGPDNIVKKDQENSDAPLNSFQQLSNSKNAFSGLASTGFSTSAFSFGSIQQDGSGSQSSLPTFSFGGSNNGSTPLFGTTGASLGSKSEGTAFPPMQEVPRETGEENEKTVFTTDSALFEFFNNGWKERGKGEVKVNVLKDESQKARLVMRTKGNLRLIMNASLYPDMKLTKMDKKGISFACVNTATEGKDGLSTFALKFKDVSVLEEFTSIVSAHKGKTVTALKTPENSPRTSDN